MPAVMITAMLTPTADGAARLRHGMVDRASRPAYRLLAVMIATIGGLVVAMGFDIDRTDLPLMTGMMMFMIGSAWLLRSRGAARVATAIEAIALLLLASMAVACLCILFAAMAMPYQDDLLERLDRLILPGFSWLDMFAALRGHDAIVAAMSVIYKSLLWQPFLLVAVLALSDREGDAWRFVHAWLLALIASVAIFAFTPAITAYPHYHLAASDIPGLSVRIGWRTQEVLELVRSGALRTLTPSQMTGVITFPSFHAASAALLLWHWRRVPVIGPPFMAWNVAMCLTVPLIGSHYFVDVIGGVAIAAVAIGAITPRIGSRPTAGEAI